MHGFISHTNDETGDAAANALFATVAANDRTSWLIYAAKDNSTQALLLALSVRHLCVVLVDEVPLKFFPYCRTCQDRPTIIAVMRRLSMRADDRDVRG